MLFNFLCFSRTDGTSQHLPKIALVGKSNFENKLKGDCMTETSTTENRLKLNKVICNNRPHPA